MKSFYLCGISCLFLFSTKAQEADVIISQVMKRQSQTHRISYSIQRTDTIGSHTRAMQGEVILERDITDTVFGFRFWGRKDNDATEKMYNGRIGYAIDTSASNYTMYYSPEEIYNLLNGGGGHLVMTDLLKLDSSGAVSCTLTTDDSCYYLVFRYPDLKEYDVFNRFKKVSIPKKTMMPVAVRQHQESYGRTQDLFFRITSSQENERALSCDFFTPVFLKTYQLVKSSRKPGPASNLKNKSAPGFNLPTFSGEMVSLNDLGGKVVLLDFWEVWCAPCIQSMSKVQELYEKYKAMGLSVCGIVNDTANIAASKEMVRKRQINFPMLQGSRQLKDMYGINGVPLYIVINRSGIITFISEGFSDEIEVAIRTAL